MLRLLPVLLALLMLAAPAAAAPGDPRVVQGTLEWPATLGAEPFVIVRGEDGRAYYADVASAQRRTPGALTSGTRLAVVGVEGPRPYEITAMAIGAGDAASLGIPVPPPAGPQPSAAVAPPVSAAVAPPPPATPAESLWRLQGTVQEVAGRSVRLRARDGSDHLVDVSQLSAGTVQRLREGEQITLFGVPRDDDRLIANGFIQSQPARGGETRPSR